MSISSIITNGSAYPYVPDGDVFHKLHPDQLLTEVVKLMVDNNYRMLPVCENDTCIGVVCLDDLIAFLFHGKNYHELLFHKLNFDLRSTILTLMSLHQKSSLSS